MPLHFTPQELSRRRFLTSVLGSIVLSSVRQPLPAQSSPPTKPNSTSESWALLSDTHIAADPNLQARGIQMAVHLRQIMSEVLHSHASLPFAGLMVSGDCAYNDGQVEDYKTFASLLKPASQAGIPIHLTLGNHDHRDRLLHGVTEHLGSPLSASSVPEKLVSSIRGKFCDWYLLDSLEETNKTPGLLGENQLRWLEHKLLAEPTRPALVMVHHNPQPPGLGNVTGLRDTEALLALLLKLPQVKVLFFGHTHVAKIVQLSGLHLVNLPACAYRFNESQPTGWTQALVDPTGCTLTLFDTAQSHSLHAKPIRLDWRSV